jgi:hypothetical protein
VPPGGCGDVLPDPGVEPGSLGGVDPGGVEPGGVDAGGVLGGNDTGVTLPLASTGAVPFGPRQHCLPSARGGSHSTHFVPAAQ